MRKRDNKHRKKLHYILLAAVCALLSVTGCAVKQKEPVNKMDFLLNTFVPVTLYDTDKEEILDGVYERHFIQDGVNYHHILDPRTGYPYENGLTQVTIISKESVDGDGLSTTCFALGLEKGMELADSLDGVYAVFITEDGELHYSEGAEALLSADQ